MIRKLKCRLGGEGVAYHYVGPISLVIWGLVGGHISRDMRPRGPISLGI